LKNVIRKIENNQNIKVVFTDLFDTLIHRTVHPHYAFRIWCKLMIRELGLSLSIVDLYQIRMCATDTLAEKLGLKKVEIPYELVTKEVYSRLVNSYQIKDIDYNQFYSYFLEADFESEKSVQFINDDLVNGLRYLKEKAFKIILVSDFHLPEESIVRLLEHHGISSIFSDVFISCDYRKSKESGDLYPFVLEQTSSVAAETAMMGDNKISDYINASTYGLNAHFLKHYKHKFRNKKNLFGSVQKEFERICKKTERSCRNSDHPFSEYILHFYFFTERLYEETKQKGIKDLFFLAREGLYLKELFDKYQDINGLNEEERIKTHYFKASRHSAMQVSLAPIDKEEFAHIKRKYDHMSARQFMSSFGISEAGMSEIASDMGIDIDEVIKSFISSDVMAAMRINTVFKDKYEFHRNTQRNAFDSYLKSFQVDFEQDGMALVDVGWGGTMQECIYHYLEGRVQVTGYYIGLREIYTIEKGTKRFGLNFSVYPKKDFSDDILLANGQLYEQLLAAPHGSTVGYSLNEDSPTLEYHEENEKKVFDEFIFPIQKFMMVQFENLCNDLHRATYSKSMAQDYLTDMALRLGLFTNRKKLKFIQLISQGFYQNMGNNKVGLVYDPKQIGISKARLLKDFLWSPEKTFRYLVKIKPLLYSKNLYLLGLPVGLSLFYIKFNRWIKGLSFDKRLL